ncbi:MAG TPA: ABC transporter permease, partial [Pyrinomonadaceae bacterium]|nr:ABC transporter permease [Pyrinomonadaceae bacterium]
MQTIWRDLRFGGRMLTKRPLFTIVAALTLALGIGANSAVFSVVNAVLLRPLPYKDASRLAMLSGFDPQRGIRSTSYSIPRFNAIRDQNSVFESLAAVGDDTFNLTGRQLPEQIQGARVSGDLFHMLGVKPYLGRTFLPEEDQAGGSRVVLLSYGLWHRLFDTDANIVNQTVELDGQSFTVVGVLPASFNFLDEKYEIWLPRAFDTSYLAPESITLGATWLTVLARLKPEVEFGKAQADLETISVRYRQNNPGNSDIATNSDLMPLQAAMVDNVRQALLVVLGVVGVVLLIACVN